MGRIPTFRTNYDDLKKLTLADLKRLGYMVGWCSGSIKWTRNGKETGSIRVAVNLDGFQPGNYVELDYIFRDTEKVKYRIQLIQLSSNLGKGYVWYFICPVTGERCRTLYQVGKYFASRKALPNTLYECQTYSKQYRWYDQVYGPSFKLERAYDDLYKPYAKKHYRGKLTPKARKVSKWERAKEVLRV